MTNPLDRLLRQHLDSFDNPSKQSLDNLFGAFSDLLEQNERERLMLEQSLMLTSNELSDINRQLKQQLSEVKNVQGELVRSLVKQKALFNASPEAMVAFSMKGTIEQANATALEFINLSQEEALNLSSKQTLTQFLRRVSNPLAFKKEIRYGDSTFNAKQSGYFETKDQRYFHYQSEPEVINGEIIGRVFCFRDITDIKRNEELLKHQAFHDTLTGLPNRAYLLESLQHAITMGKRHNKKTAVLFIDLDDFKRINDIAGHEQGDIFLKSISSRIQSTLRESDTLGRLGGDEFLIILEDIEHQSQAIEIHKRILKLFSEPFLIKGNEYPVTCSIGISLHPQDGHRPDELIRKADMAMYQAKKTGKNTFHYFDESLERLAIHRVKTETDLRNAINNQQFILHFQPKVSLTTRKIIGVEALIRWEKSPNEIIYPDQFIPLAEDLGLITDISYWLVQKICTTLSSWKNTCLDNLPISINLSAIDFNNSTFINKALETICSYDINPKLIEIELTETVLSENLARVNQVIKQFKDQHIKISIDDFGTGYSSFSYLQDLNIDYLKIDKSFISNLKRHPKSLAIIKSIIDMGSNLGLAVIAEGIENDFELEQLIAAGCHIGQGHLFSKPVDETLLIKHMEQSNLQAAEPA